MIQKSVGKRKQTLKDKVEMLKIYCEKLTKKDDESYLRLLLTPYDLDEDIDLEKVVA